MALNPVNLKILLKKFIYTEINAIMCHTPLKK